MIPEITIKIPLIIDEAANAREQAESLEDLSFIQPPVEEQLSPPGWEEVKPFPLVEEEKTSKEDMLIPQPPEPEHRMFEMEMVDTPPPEEVLEISAWEVVPPPFSEGWVELEDDVSLQPPLEGD